MMSFLIVKVTANFASSFFVSLFGLIFNEFLFSGNNCGDLLMQLLPLRVVKMFSVINFLLREMIN